MTDTTDDLDGNEEPDVLGAATTVDLTKKKRRELKREEKVKRRALAKQSAAPVTPIGPVDDEPLNYSGIEDVFEPHRVYTPPIRPYLASLWERRAFMIELAKSQLRGSRSSTALGGLWGILDPLFQAAIYYFLFTIIRGDAGRPSDFLFILIAGILVFQVSAGALTEGGNSIRQGSSLMLNSTFPRALLPLASVYKGVLRVMPAFIVIFGAQFVLGAPYTWNLLWLPVLFTIQVLTAIGMSLISATLIVYFRDASNSMTYVSRILFFTTPIIYPYSLVEKYDHIIAPINPLYSIFVNYQKMWGGETISFNLLWLSVLWAFVLVVVGGRQFLRHERDFASRL